MGLHSHAIGMLHTVPGVEVLHIGLVGARHTVLAGEGVRHSAPEEGRRIDLVAAVDNVWGEDRSQAVGRRIGLEEGDHRGLGVERHSGHGVAAGHNLAGADSRRTVDSALVVPGTVGGAVAVRMLGMEGLLWGISTKRRSAPSSGPGEGCSMIGLYRRRLTTYGHSTAVGSHPGADYSTTWRTKMRAVGGWQEGE